MCVRLAELGITENIMFVTKEEFYEYSMSIDKISDTFSAKFDLDRELPKDYLGEAQHMGCHIYFLLKP